MAEMKYPLPLQKLIALLKKIPGVGQRTAERYAFQMIQWKDSDLSNLAYTLANLKIDLIPCPECGALKDASDCNYCNNPRRDQRTLCIVSSPKDIFAIENTAIFNGVYHVMPGLLSPIDGLGPEEMKFELLKSRIESLKIREVILALDSTVEGDATALFLKRELAKLDVVISRLALGMPLGSSLDYIDEGTLSQALSARLPI